MNQQNIQQAIESYQNGKSGSQIKTEFGIPPSSLFRILRSRNIKPRSEYIPDAIKLAAVQDYRDGMLIKNIVVKHSIKRTSLFRWLRASKVNRRPQKRKFTEQDIEALNAAYAAGESIRSLIERFQTTYNTIGPLIRNKRTPSEYARKYTSQQADEIINDFANGDDIGTICERHRCCKFTVKNLIRKRKAARRRLSKFSCNDLFFSRLDSENKLYWFGFLLADGHVHKPKTGGKYLEINLGMKDIAHLELLRQNLGYSGPIKEMTVHHTKAHKTYRHVNLRIKRARLVEDLERYGFSLIKDGDITQLTQFSDGQIRHIIRGFFDGDGSIYVVRKNLVWYLCDSHREIIEYFMSRCPVVSRHNACGQAHKWRVSYGGNRIVPAICAWLYDNATVYLARKKQIYNNWQEENLL